MNIEFDKIPEDLTLESFVILIMLVEKRFDDIELIKEKYHTSSVLMLSLKGYIKITNSNPNSWIIRKKTLDLFPQSDKLDLKILATQMRDLFPKGVKSGGYSVRSSVKDLEDKLKKFIKNYK